MFLEKYKPKDFNSFIGSKKDIENLLSFLETGKGGLIITGSTGVGKTLIIELAAKQLNYEICSLNADDFRSGKEIERVLIEASKQKSMFSDGKIIVVDEADAISDYGASGTLTELLKISKFPLVLVANDLYSKNLYNLRKKCKLIKLQKPRYDAIAEFLIKICREEKIKYEEGAIRQMARICDGDIRAVLIDLESLAPYGATKEGINILGERGRDLSIFETIRLILKVKTIQGLGDLSDYEIDKIFEWLKENIHREYTGDDLSKAYEFLTKADKFKQRMIKSQAWPLMKYYKELSIIGVALSKNKVNQNFIAYKPPRFIKTMYKNMSSS